MENLPIGTIINTLAVLVGSTIGLLIRSRLPERYREILFTGIGLATIALGLSMVLEYKELIHVILATLLGALTGEWLGIEQWMEKKASQLKHSLKSNESAFSEGLVTAFILFCVGPVTIIGALNEGLQGDRTLILTKSMLDGFSSIFLASAYGIGVLISAFALLIFQSMITVAGYFLQSGLSEGLANYLTSTGGIMILGLGINLLGIKKIRIANFLPSLIYVFLIYAFL